MAQRNELFVGDNPFEISQRWLAEATKTEPNDPNAIALSTVDAEGMPNVRMVLLKEIEADAFVFYTNYDSKKGKEIIQSGKIAFVLHWKTLQRQIRVRGSVTKEDGSQADAYYSSRSLQSRLGAWSSAQSQPLSGRADLMAEVAKQGALHGNNPSRPPFWGGFRIVPQQIEFWADGDFRLHDRFAWSRNDISDEWSVQRLSP